MAPMHLVLIGMSGIGKSYWAKQLAQLWHMPFTHFDCDALIAERLGKIVDAKPGEEPVHAVGRWMGMPWSEGYAERESAYLDFERDVVAKVIDAQQSHLCSTPNRVIDTTGSVVYIGDELLENLTEDRTVVYFDTPQDIRQQMVELYLNEPKPVLWQDMYRPHPSEPQGDALARCYAELLADRAEKYSALADIVIGYDEARQPGFDLLNVIISNSV